MTKNKATAKDRSGWVKWLERYGADKFFDSFVRVAQGAESRCKHCGQSIFLDIVEGGGCPDWRTSNGDYGCGNSPYTNAEGTGGHEAFKG
jgi:hypothetical protein